jgi:hypothetical protein
MRDTIDMAREAGFNLNFRITGSNEALDRLVEYVRADTLANIDPSKFMSYQEAFEAGRLAEREACAKVCEEVLEQYRGTSMGKHAELVGDDCAAAIRARGNT